MRIAFEDRARRPAGAERPEQPVSHGLRATARVVRDPCSNDPAFHIAAKFAAQDGRNYMYGFEARMREYALKVSARMAVSSMWLDAIGFDIVTALDCKTDPTARAKRPARRLGQEFQVAEVAKGIGRGNHIERGDARSEETRDLVLMQAVVRFARACLGEHAW